MSHEHYVHDSDGYFIIDPISKEIINNTNGKTTVVQYDHNSEQFTFNVPKLIENHDMSKCDLIQIHYVNESKGTSISTRNSNSGIYTVSDMKLNPDDDSSVIFTWLLTREVTQYAGSIKFQIRFICYGNDDIADYVLGTKIFSSIEVAPAYDNSEIVINGGSDLLLDFERRISDLEDSIGDTPGETTITHKIWFQEDFEGGE